jgi:hypothetical protein
MAMSGCARGVDAMPVRIDRPDLGEVDGAASDAAADDAGPNDDDLGVSSDLGAPADLGDLPDLEDLGAPTDLGTPVDLGDPIDAAPAVDLGVPPDLGFCMDGDGDGFPSSAGCGAMTDCDDTRAEVRPGGVEACNSRDDDCDGSVDEDFGGATSCGVGACRRTVSSCAGGVPGACVPGTPLPEVCNGLDDDCNGLVDDGLSALVCGVGRCERVVPACLDGAPQACVPGPVAAETCNGVDDDCDGTIDEGVCLPTGPANDACAGAIVLTGATGTRTTDTLAGASADVSDCAPGGVEVFYRLDVSERSVVYLDTLGTAFDTSLSYRGTTCPGPAIVCENDACGTAQEQLVVVVEPGVHHFAVHTRTAATPPGPLSLRWQVMRAAGGSNLRITSSGSYSGTTAGTTNALTATCGGSARSGENAVHFTVCPGAPRTISADTCASFYNTVLHMRGPAGEIACNDDGCGFPYSRLSAVSASGVGLYQLVIDGFPTGLLPTGAYTLAVTSF